MQGLTLASSVTRKLRRSEYHVNSMPFETARSCVSSQLQTLTLFNSPRRTNETEYLREPSEATQSNSQTSRVTSHRLRYHVSKHPGVSKNKRESALIEGNFSDSRGSRRYEGLTKNGGATLGAARFCPYTMHKAYVNPPWASNASKSQDERSIRSI